MARIVKLLILIFFIGTSATAAEIIKAEPILTTAPIIRPQMTTPTTQPVQTVVPAVTYVPKATTTTQTAVKNATLNISAHQTTPQVAVNQVSPVQPQLVSFQQCTKIFPTDSENLFYLALAAVNANRFKIDEIQTKSGYILFSVAKKQFLLSTATVDKKNAIIKITPTNSSYYFPVGIVTNVFKYINLNINMPVTKI